MTPANAGAFLSGVLVGFVLFAWLPTFVRLLVSP